MLTYMIGTLTVVAIISYYFTSWRRRRKYKLPPGPNGLPFFGNVFQLDKKGPHKTITEWQKDHGDIFMIKMFGADYVVLNSYEAIYEGLVTKANDFAGRPKLYRTEVIRDYAPDIAFSTYNRKWVFMKKLTMTTLKMYGNNLQSLEAISIDLIEGMTAELEEMANIGGAFDAQPIIHRCVTGIITSILYGTKVADSDVRNLLDATNEGMQYNSNSGPQVALDMWPWLRFLPMRSLYNKLVELKNKISHWFLREAEATKKRYEPGNPKCLLDGLFEYQQTSAEKQMEFTLTDHDIYGIMTNIIFAGTATTSITLYALVALWINLPWLQDKMANEVISKIGKRTVRLEDRAILTYVEAAILELLRYTTIVPLNVPHYTMVDTSVGGYDIPKDTRVFYNLWKLHHDEEFWDSPWDFRPERFLDDEGKVVLPDHPNRKRVLAFGASRRVCVGETLARNRLFLMVVALLQRFQFEAEAKDKRPVHDPRQYISGFGIIPPNYNVRLYLRGANERDSATALA